MKYICTVCGQVIESDTLPEVCPVCGAKTFKVMDEENSGRTFFQLSMQKRIFSFFGEPPNQQ